MGVQKFGKCNSILELQIMKYRVARNKWIELFLGKNSSERIQEGDLIWKLLERWKLIENQQLYIEKGLKQKYRIVIGKSSQFLKKFHLTHLINHNE